MQINEDFGVTPAKLAELKNRVERLHIKLDLIVETFSRGGGKGGQKVNKTANRVQLRYAPLNLIVACQRDRKRSLNRFLALRELVDRIEIQISPETSARLREIERIRRRKSRSAARSSAKTSSAPDA